MFGASSELASVMEFGFCKTRSDHIRSRTSQKTFLALLSRRWHDTILQPSHNIPAKMQFSVLFFKLNIALFRFSTSFSFAFRYLAIPFYVGVLRNSEIQWKRGPLNLYGARMTNLNTPKARYTQIPFTGRVGQQCIAGVNTGRVHCSWTRPVNTGSEYRPLYAVVVVAQGRQWFINSEPRSTVPPG